MPSVIVQLNQANITASTKTGNLLANTELANVPLGDSDVYEITIYAVSSASGANITLQSAEQTLINDKEIIGIGTTLNTDSHELGAFEVISGSPLQLTLRETAAVGTTDVLLRIEAEPVEY